MRIMANGTMKSIRAQSNNPVSYFGAIPKYVDANVVKGNLTAQASHSGQKNAASFGGNVVRVYSTEAIPQNVKIQADWYVGRM